MLQNTFDDKSIVVQVIAWCCQAKENITWRNDERERLSLSAFLGTEDIGGPYSPYKLCNHNLYIGIIIFPHIDNPQSTGYN